MSEAKATAPTAKLAERLRSKIEEQDLDIVGVVCTTFNLECSSIEGYIIPSIFGLQKSDELDTYPRARLAEITSRFSEKGSPIIFYDKKFAKEIANQDTTLRLNYLEVNHPKVNPKAKGVQHSKHVFVLLGDSATNSVDKMVFVTGSANLTKAGWAKNVECVDIQILEKNQKTSLKDGLDGLMKYFGTVVEYYKKDGLKSENDLKTFHYLQMFIDSLQPKEGYPKLWCGQQDVNLDKFFEDIITNEDGMLEKIVIGSKFVTDTASPIRKICKLSRDLPVQVMCPKLKGAEKIHEGNSSWIDNVRKIKNVTLHWFKPLHVEGAKEDKYYDERTVHAKFYLFYFDNKLLVGFGSPNLTEEAFTRMNFESLILHKVSECSSWSPLDSEVINEGPESSGSSSDPTTEHLPDNIFTWRLIFDWKEESICAYNSNEKTPGTPQPVNVSANIDGEEYTIDLKHLEPIQQPDKKLIEFCKGSNNLLPITYKKQPQEGREIESQVLILQKNFCNAPNRFLESLSTKDYFKIFQIKYLQIDPKQTEQKSRDKKIIDYIDNYAVSTEKLKNNHKNKGLLLSLIYTFKGLEVRKKALENNPSAKEDNELYNLLLSPSQFSILNMLKRFTEEIEIRSKDMIVEQAFLCIAIKDFLSSGTKIQALEQWNSENHSEIWKLFPVFDAFKNEIYQKIYPLLHYIFQNVKNELLKESASSTKTTSADVTFKVTEKTIDRFFEWLEEQWSYPEKNGDK